LVEAICPADVIVHILVNDRGIDQNRMKQAGSAPVDWVAVQGFAPRVREQKSQALRGLLAKLATIGSGPV
jgi:hypothetical protein